MTPAYVAQPQSPPVIYFRPSAEVLRNNRFNTHTLHASIFCYNLLRVLALASNMLTDETAAETNQRIALN